MQAVRSAASACRRTGTRSARSMSISLSVDAAGNLFVVWSDFRNNTNQNCTGDARPGQAALRQRRLLRVLDRRRRDLDRTRPRSRRALTRGSARPRSGRRGARWRQTGHLWVAFYDRSFGNCESTGCNDVHAAEITNPASASPTYRLLPRDDELDAELDRRRTTRSRRASSATGCTSRSTARTGRTSPGRTRGRSRARHPKRMSTTRGFQRCRPARRLHRQRSRRHHRRLQPRLLHHPRRRLRRRHAQPPPRCRVPRVVGLRLAKAKSRLRRARCSVRAVRRVRAKAVGKVVAQSPRAGVVRVRGFRVRLTVGRR